MSAKIITYLLVIPFVVLALESINMNMIFKKNREIQARMFYLLLLLSFTYILGSLLYDFISVIKII